MRRLIAVAVSTWVLGSACGGNVVKPPPPPPDNTLHPLDPTRCVVRAEPLTALADGVATTHVHVELYADDDSPVQHRKVGLEASGTGNLLPAAAQTGADGKVTLDLAATVAELKTLHAVVDPDGTPIVLPPLVQVTFTPGAPAATSSTFAWILDAAPSDGTTPARALITVKDALGNLVPGAMVSSSASSSFATVTPAAGTTDTHGQLEVQVVSTRSGTVHVSCVAGTVTLGGDATFALGPPDPLTSFLSSSPVVGVADGLSPVTVTVHVNDAAGTALQGQAVSLSVSGVVTQLSSTSSGTTAADGTFSAQLLSTVTGTASVSCSVGGFTVQRDVTFVPGPVDTGTSTFVANPTSVANLGQSTVALTARDAQGNLVPNFQVSFSASLDGGTTGSFNHASTSTDAAGRASAVFTATSAGVITLTATGNGLSLQAQVTSTPTCTDVQKNGLETDVDCGGGTCGACANGKACLAHADCASNHCQSLVCAPANCFDGVLNGSETDTDCGGGLCAKCADTRVCTGNSDCVSDVCSGGHCQVPSCTDNHKNGLETAIDCGGGSCPKCADTLGCSVDGDCQSSHCVGGFCAVPTCTDSRKNGTETALDCGGSCPKCADTLGCNVDGDCQSVHCVGGFCAVPTCSDLRKNGLETDQDCGGGVCPKCADTKLCSGNADCVSDVCSGGTCQVPTCTDNHKNGLETAIDCGGGTCPKCADTKACTFNTDCVSAHCFNLVCVSASCNDGIKNGLETGLDCGGPCTPCADTLGCNVDADCQSVHCVGGFCAVPTCSDLRKNGLETDQDCGGGVCPKCADTKLCSGNGDCVSDVCSGGHCQVPTCADNHKNAQETDVDCGGPACPKCGVLKLCLGDGDCSSALCAMSRCREVAFATETVGTASGTPTGVTIGDLSGDGRPDVVAAIYSTNAVATFAGLSDGGVTAPVESPAAIGASAVVVGHFNADSYPDVVTDGMLYGPTVMLGLPDGGLTAPGAMLADMSRDVAMGDFNNDGIPDLVFAVTLSRWADVLLGDGDGGFPTLRSGGNCINPMKVAVGDLNNDGALDFALACDNAGLGTNGFVDLVFNTGTGNIFTHNTINAGNGTRGVAIGRLNADALPDVVAANNADNTITVFLNLGGGVMDVGTTYSGLPTGPESVVMADFNGDGAQDVAVVSSGASKVSVFLGRGDGTLAPPVIFSTGPGPADIAAGDLNGDGKPDLATSNQYSNDVTVLLSQCR